MSKVGIITGGASGMGLSVAKLLSSKGWELHLFDMNEKAGKAAVEEVPKSTFHNVNVTDWDSLSKAFDKVFKSSGNTLDFVFANAGIVERDNFYAKIGTLPPPEPNQLSIDINLKSVVNTVFLAQHYFRASPHGGRDKAVVMTSSCGALYPSQFSPMYSGAKAGVVNFMRSIAWPYHHYDGIRCYAICPGTVETNLLSKEDWASWPREYFTPVSKIANTVEMLVNGGDMKDSWGKEVKDGANFGLAVEINMNNHYFREQPEYCDDAMKNVMISTGMENQAKRLEKKA